MIDEWSGWIPILRVTDSFRSAQFYCDVLGFTKDWEHRVPEGLPRYFQVSKGALILHLSEHGAAGHCANTCVGVPDVDAVFLEFTSRGLQTEGPPTDRDYGVRDFGFKDPDGHHFVFSMKIDGFAQSRTV